jgi:hypothetical protein
MKIRESTAHVRSCRPQPQRPIGFRAVRLLTPEHQRIQTESQDSRARSNGRTRGFMRPFNRPFELRSRASTLKRKHHPEGWRSRKSASEGGEQSTLSFTLNHPGGRKNFQPIVVSLLNRLHGGELPMRDPAVSDKSRQIWLTALVSMISKKSGLSTIRMKINREICNNSFQI